MIFRVGVFGANFQQVLRTRSPDPFNVDSVIYPNGIEVLKLLTKYVDNRALFMWPNVVTLYLPKVSM